MEVLKTFILGWIILVGAIGLNAVASRLGLTSWYDLLTHKKTLPHPASLLWLILVYPLGLGAIGWLGLMLLQF